MKQVFLPDIRELAIVRRDLRQDSLGRCIPMSIIALLPHELTSAHPERNRAFRPDAQQELLTPAQRHHESTFISSYYDLRNWI